MGAYRPTAIVTLVQGKLVNVSCDRGMLVVVRDYDSAPPCSKYSQSVWEQDAKGRTVVR